MCLNSKAIVENGFGRLVVKTHFTLESASLVFFERSAFTSSSALRICQGSKEKSTMTHSKDINGLLLIMRQLR